MIDSPPTEPTFEQALADLAWLGLDWDIGPVVQTQRLALYQNALARLRQLNEMNAANPSLTADSYRAQLLDDLQAESQSLDLTRTRLEWRKRRRRDDPSGVRRWLLLFRPEGIAGWFLQSFFYGVLLVTIFLVREVGALRRQDITGWSTATVCWILFTLYVWNVALVHRHL